MHSGIRRPAWTDTVVHTSTHALAFPFPLSFLLAQLLWGEQCETDTAIISVVAAPPLPSSHTTGTGVPYHNERTAAALLKILLYGHWLGCEAMHIPAWVHSGTGLGSVVRHAGLGSILWVTRVYTFSWQFFQSVYLQPGDNSHTVSIWLFTTRPPKTINIVLHIECQITPCSMVFTRHENFKIQLEKYKKCLCFFVKNNGIQDGQHLLQWAVWYVP